MVVDEPEARLATCNQYGDIKTSLIELHATVADKIVITLGKKGAIGIDHDGIFSEPAYTDKVVDTIGAGDAFFAVTALVAEHASMPDILRIGNAAGALKTGIVGHQREVKRHELIRMLA
jgi:sugar/nucleoside kinase (ribokinase family)